jgi:NADP-dependent 3-hydroxy acid dehydrogenase YdfG
MSNRSNIEGKVVITGVSSGLGEATVQLLSAEGVIVVLSARRIEHLQSLADGLTARGGTALAIAQEVKPYNIRTTIISPGAVATELPSSTTEPDVAANLHQFYKEYAIPADSFTRAVAFAVSQPEEVDINEILFRPTRQEL